MASSSQKFIARNRAPRVQIEYDVEVYGAEKKVQLPFVMGVMADLAGNPADPLPAVADRKFLEIDVDSFDSRMKAMRPRAAFAVPNTLTGVGSLAVDLTFEAMDDFSPAAIARRVEPLRALLQARTELANLTTYMDGKAGAERLIERVLGDPSVLAALVAGRDDPDTAAILDTLRAVAPGAEPMPDETAAALDALRAVAPGPEPVPDETAAALSALRAVAPGPEPVPDETAAALSALRAAAPGAEPMPEETAAALDALRAAAPGSEPVPDETAAALSALRALAPGADGAPDETAAALEVLRTAGATVPVEPEEAGAGALQALRDRATPPGDGPDPMADALAALRTAMPEAQAAADPTAGALDTLRAAVADRDFQQPPEDPAGALADLLAVEASRAPPQEDPLAGLADLLALGQPVAPPTLPAGDMPPDPPSETPFAGLSERPAAGAPRPAPLPPDADAARAPGEGAEQDPLAMLDALLNIGGAAPDAGDPLDDLDALLASDTSAASSDPLDDLDALLAFDTSAATPDDPLADLDALLTLDTTATPGDPLDDLDALLASSALRTDPPEGASPARGAGGRGDDTLAGPAFGRLTAPLPSPEALARPVFRMAILGDFSGRAARGEVSTGAALAARRGVALDIDNAEQVIGGFAMDLVLPIGAEGAGIAVPLADLDALHPDRLVENVALFDELKGLRQRLSTPSMAAGAVAEMQGWGGAFRDMAAPAASRSAATSVPADLRLSDFQRLVGDGAARPAAASPAADLIARIVGPHVVPGPNPQADALRAAVDEAMTAAMRLVLHHPEFQAIEAQWRAIDLLARRIETDARLQLVLYDISAAELGADLAGAADLSQSGIFGLLNAPLDEEGGCGFSAVFGLYTFEETPPHADLLGRMARIAEHVQAPFFAAMSPAHLETARADRHPLVAAAWDALGAEPAAAWLGLATPRFLMRRPYGARSEPIDAFDFEEFTMAAGLSGMLWGNPVILVAILLARAWTDGRGKPVLGQTMSLGEMPYHFVTDRDGDQVPLPCTERNMTTAKVEATVARGFMPVIGIRGRDVVRLGSFQSVAGGEILGRWSGNLPPPRAPAPQPAPVAAEAPPAAASLDDELDALLAGFGDAPAAPADPAAIDAELAALLEGL